MILLRRLALLLTLTLLGTAAFAAQRSAPLVEPAPITIPANVSEENAAKAIRSALAGRGWAISEESPGHIGGTLTVRKHVLKIGISYTGGRIGIKYVTSSELGYEIIEGKPYIHPKFNNWMNNLILDINANLLRV